APSARTVPGQPPPGSPTRRYSMFQVATPSRASASQSGSMRPRSSCDCQKPPWIHTPPVLDVPGRDALTRQRLAERQHETEVVLRLPEAAVDHDHDGARRSTGRGPRGAEQPGV